MSKQDCADRNWWREVGRLVDPNTQLYGWSYRNSGSFRNPNLEINGRVAAVLMSQHAEIERLCS